MYRIPFYMEAELEKMQAAQAAGQQPQPQPQQQQPQQQQPPSGGQPGAVKVP